MGSTVRLIDSENGKGILDLGLPEEESSMALERLEFEFIGEPGKEGSNPGVLHVGHVMSGDLEILAEPMPDNPLVTKIHVTTGAIGFGDVWRRVIDEFMDSHDMWGYEIWINDDGATPAVVKLRLWQLVRELPGKHS